MVAAYDPTSLPRGHPLAALARDGRPPSRVDRVPLGRLGTDAVAEIAGLLVGGEDEEEVAAFLEAHAQGLPLHLVELVNCLSNEGALVAVSERR